LRNHGKNSYRGGFLTRLMLTKMHISNSLDTDSTAYFTAFNEKACAFSFAHFGATFYVAMIIGERPPARRNVQAEEKGSRQTAQRRPLVSPEKERLGGGEGGRSTYHELRCCRHAYCMINFDIQ
jgi:hypothetical protein